MEAVAPGSRLLLGTSALVAVLVALGGCRAGARPERADPAASFDRPAAERILAARAQAVADREKTGFLAGIDPDAPGFRARQEELFANLGRVPLENWHESIAAAGPQGGGTLLTLRLHYRIKGFDRGDVVHTSYLTLSGKGMIVGDGRTTRDDPEIWSEGRVSVVRGRHSLVIGNEAGTATLRQVAERLDDSVPLVSAVVGDRWPRRVVALVPADDTAAVALAGGQNLTAIVALATVTQNTDRSPGQDRVLISPGVYAKLNPLGRQVVLTHELTHVATSAAGDSRTPMWLVEGFADYVGYRKAAASVRSAARELRDDLAQGKALPAALPTREEFDGQSDGLSQVYQSSWLACRMIAERYGEATLLRLYRAAGTQSQEEAVRAVLGVSLAQLVREWRAYLRGELG
ncbi:MAG: hypothetical protein ABIS86_19470 [Streptosporangiaceae bacterium]